MSDQHWGYIIQLLEQNETKFVKPHKSTMAYIKLSLICCNPNLQTYLAKKKNNNNNLLKVS